MATVKFSPAEVGQNTMKMRDAKTTKDMFLVFLRLTMAFRKLDEEFGTNFTDTMLKKFKDEK